MSNLPDKTRYNNAELREFETLILQKIKVAEESLAQLQDSLDSSNEQNIGRSINFDEFSDFAEKEYLMTMIARQRNHIENLENALVRIKNRSYGICKRTGKLIDKRRLLLVPHTTLSVEAKEGGQVA